MLLPPLSLLRRPPPLRRLLSSSQRSRPSWHLPHWPRLDLPLDLLPPPRLPRLPPGRSWWRRHLPQLLLPQPRPATNLQHRAPMPHKCHMAGLILRPTSCGLQRRSSHGRLRTTTHHLHPTSGLLRCPKMRRLCHTPPNQWHPTSHTRCRHTSRPIWRPMVCRRRRPEVTIYPTAHHPQVMQ